MQRYFLNEDKSIQKDDVHHILNVMRFKSGTEVELCINGECFLAILEINQKEVTYIQKDALKSHPPLNMIIIQGLPKGDKIEFVTKSATLFNVKEIIFVPMKRSIAKLSNIEHKLTRLEKISKEAAELSKRSALPKIKFMKQLSDFEWGNKQVILLDELETTQTLKILEKFNLNQDIYIIIGPEGGIDSSEREMLISFGAHPLSLGASILPTEFAHIPILNALLYIKT